MAGGWDDHKRPCAGLGRLSLGGRALEMGVGGGITVRLILVAGIALSTVGGQMMKNNRGLRRRANKTLRNVGDLMDNMQYLFK